MPDPPHPFCSSSSHPSNISWLNWRLLVVVIAGDGAKFLLREDDHSKKIITNLLKHHDEDVFKI